MDDFSSIKSLIGTAVTILALYFGYKRLKIMSRKDNFDKTDFNNKQINFSVYIHQGYRLYDKNKENLKYLLFHIDINNKSTSKITVTPSARITLKNQSNTILLGHNKLLFLKNYHENIEKLDNNVSLEERGKKTGWIIFEMPKEIIDRRIEKVQIVCEDTILNQGKADFYLLKDIYYENKID